MTYNEAFLDLQDTAVRISNGINAIGIMTMGLAEVKDPYAGGFNVVWNYLVDAERDFQRQLTVCLNTEVNQSKKLSCRSS